MGEWKDDSSLMIVLQSFTNAEINYGTKRVELQRERPHHQSDQPPEFSASYTFTASGVRAQLQRHPCAKKVG